MQNEARADYGVLNIDGETQRLQFLIRSILSRSKQSTPVEVIDVTNSGGVSPIGYVTIRPLVQQLDGNGNAIDHGDIHGVPYLRIQGGVNAVILDPQVGDIGIALFCDKDISVVKSTGAAAPPGSNRTNHMADAIYLQSIIGAAPTQYVQFTAAGINVVSPTKVTVQAPNIGLVGNVAASGGTLTHNGVNVGSTHVHAGVTAGNASTGLPQ